MPNIEELAEQLADGEKGQYMAWLEALSEGAFLQGEAHLGERAFRISAESCATPKQFSLLVEAFDEHAKEHPYAPNGFNLLADHVDDSPDPLSDWIVAVEYFYDWLAQKGRTSPGLAQILEYISCCVESQKGLPHKESLVNVLTDMLDRYGYEG
ncbi:hypothetical protein [Cerasicoccus arenae]|uniref:Uncharacterized protein n=1 Tax=Cerasicoccus arenae TaxID=424488 RepID=A0A8J3GET3_9BACT|nr:hypothetical protein [Cerasicoccus arenae]MBK1859181.1 hypothetical protein [Cerasicoccus arenae]GHC01110.1 hypothetical protein GCM10007047_16910 [Cerasicoccus arenae]